MRKVHNISTWFDEDDMDKVQEANLARKMQHGIDNSKLVLVFVTEQYMKKVENKTLNDNCKLEFEYAVRVLFTEFLLCARARPHEKKKSWELFCGGQNRVQ